MSFGMGIILASVVFALAVGWYRPLFLDLLVGKVASREGELRRSKTVGLLGEAWYVSIAGQAFPMSKRERDAFEEGHYRAYLLPRTGRLVATERLSAVEPEQI